MGTAPKDPTYTSLVGGVTKRQKLDCFKDTKNYVTAQRPQNNQEGDKED